jgi:hypothetical protein
MSYMGYSEHDEPLMTETPVAAYNAFYGIEPLLTASFKAWPTRASDL